MSEAFLEGLKPTQEEIQAVKAKNRERLIEKCRTSVVLKNGCELILFLRKCLASRDLGELMIGLIGCTGLRQIEVVCRAEIGKPKFGHDTDEIYWANVTGLCKKRAVQEHERPLLAKRDLITDALKRLRTEFFPHLQDWTDDNTTISRKVCKKINRAIRQSWPFPEINLKRVSSHFFRSLYVVCTFHYFNKSSSLAVFANDVLCHSSPEISIPYTCITVTGFDDGGGLVFDTKRVLSDMKCLLDNMSRLQSI